MSKLVTSGTGHDRCPSPSPGPSGTQTPPYGGDKKIRKTGFGFKGTAKIFGGSSCSSDEQLGAGRREGDESSGFVHLQPAALDREFEARTVLGRAAAVTEEKRLVDFLDVDTALNWLNGVRDLEDSARGPFRSA